ncbi:MAG: hypothetical protein LAO04_22105 [Acidobacteriia bacterium]|nr:hypothetical protein [Terriglobia bacterium]
MSSQAINVREVLCLKEPSGWFAAGASFRRALRTLSDGAFKLFAHLCLEADRRTGRFEAVQAELAKAVGKSRRIVGKYIEELQHKEVCTVRSGRNQYARTCFEIRDNYWPYRRTQEVESANGQVCNAYVEAIKSRFVAIGCTVGKFSDRDVQFAQDLQRRGVPLETVQNALLMGAVRKYISWLNGGSPQPIVSLAYFSEIQEQPLPAGYSQYLQGKVVQLAREWAKESSKGPKNGECKDMPSTKIVQ